MKRSGGEKTFTFSTVTDDYLDEYTKIVFLGLGLLWLKVLVRRTVFL